MVYPLRGSSKASSGIAVHSRFIRDFIRLARTLPFQYLEGVESVEPGN
ncbi:MAG: hypothetical protein P8144_05740 [Gammaproteobacteria bacterium]